MASHSVIPFTQQLFPFQGPMMSHIRDQCPSSLHAKLIQTCKLFFAKNPIVVVEKLEIEGEKYTLLNEGVVPERLQGDARKLECKIWVQSKLHFKCYPINLPLFLNSVYWFSVDTLSFFLMKITVSELKNLLTKGCCKKLYFYENY